MKKLLLIIGLFLTFFLNINLVFSVWDSNDILETAIGWNKTVIVDGEFTTNWNIEDSRIVRTLIPNAIKLFLYLAVSISVLWIIYWWITMATSWGEEDRYYQWWKNFAYSLVGLFIIIFSRAIVSIVETIRISDKTVAWHQWTSWWELINNSSFIWNLPSWEVISDIFPYLVNSVLKLIFVAIILLFLYIWIIFITTNEDDKRDKMKALFIDGITWLIVILTSYALIQWFLSIDF